MHLFWSKIIMDMGYGKMTEEEILNNETEVYMCTFCTKSFFQYSNAARHLGLYHSEDILDTLSGEFKLDQCWNRPNISMIEIVIFKNPYVLVPKASVPKSGSSSKKITKKCSKTSKRLNSANTTKYGLEENHVSNSHGNHEEESTDSDMSNLFSPCPRSDTISNKRGVRGSSTSDSENSQSDSDSRTTRKKQKYSEKAKRKTTSASLKPASRKSCRKKSTSQDIMIDKEIIHVKQETEEHDFGDFFNRVGRVDDSDENEENSCNAQTDMGSDKTDSDVDFQTKRKVVKKFKSKSTKTTVPLPNGGVEIRLDTLKASEIETLLNDFFGQHPTLPNKTNENELVSEVRKSKRSVRSVVPRTFGLLDSEDEEIIRTGQPALSKDEPSSDSDQEWDANVLHRGKKRKRRQKKRNLRSTNRDQSDVLKEVKSENASNTDSDLMIVDKVDTDKQSGEDTEMEEPSRRRSHAGVPHVPWCRICTTPFDTWQLAYEHYQDNHMTDGVFICPFASCKKKSKKPRTITILKEFLKHLRHSHPAKTKFNVRASYECKYCDKKYFSQTELEKHVAAHERRIDPRKPFHCPHCSSTFLYKDNMIRHMNMHLQNNPFICKFEGCGRKFNSDYNLRRHARLHLPRTFLECDQCPRSYVKPESLRYHKMVCHSIQNENIKKFKRSWRNNNKPLDAEKRHLHIKPSDNKEEIEKWSKVLGISGSISNIKTGNQVVPCVVWNDNNRLNVEETAIGENTTEKNQNNMEYAPEKNGTEHPDGSDLSAATSEVYPLSKYQRSTPMGKIRCKICLWSCNRTYSLHRHMKIYHPDAIDNSTAENSGNQLQMICGCCGYGAKDGNDLDEHMKKEHQGHLERKFPCSFCGIRFHTEIKKIKHERKVHLTDKKYTCSKCKKTFSTSATLKTHLKNVHTSSQETFTCKICGKVCKTLPSLKVHEKLHTGEKELSTCQMCGQTCAGRHSLRRHINYVHLGVPNPWRKRENHRTKVVNAAKKILSGASPIKPHTDPNVVSGESTNSQENTEINQDNQEEADTLLGI